MSKKDPMPRLCLRCDEDTAALLERIAVSEGTTKSEVIRRLVKDGIKAQDIPESEKDFQTLLQPVIREVMKPYVERLASIAAKSAQISAASFFMDACITDSIAGPNTAKTLAVKAHKTGTEYLSMTKGQGMEDLLLDLLKNKD